MRGSVSNASASPTQSPERRWQSLRLIAVMMTPTPLLLGLVLFPSWPDEDRLAAPATWIVVAQVIVAVAILLACEALLHRAPPIPADTDADAANERAVAAYSVVFFQRVAYCEGLAVVSVVAAYLVDPSSWLTYAVGGFLSLVLLVLEVLPNERTTTKIKESLERDGARVTVF